MWARGDVVLYRFVRDGRVLLARPLRVVEDRDDLLVAWLAAGTPTIAPTLPGGAPIRSAPLAERSRLGREPRLSYWRGSGILKLVPKDAAHSVWLFGGGDGTFRGWYVNLEQRHRWHARGVDTRDHVLDIWVERDRTWRWKDEDELEAAVAAGVIPRDRARRIRAEGERVVRAIEAWAPPFSDGWERWRPPTDWGAPALPPDWAEL